MAGNVNQYHDFLSIFCQSFIIFTKSGTAFAGGNGESFGFCLGCGEKMRAASEEAARGGRKALPDFRRGVPAYYYPFFMGEVILLNYII